MFQNGIDILGVFQQILLAVIRPIVNFIVGFFPNGDPQVYSVIDNFGHVGAGSTFDVFYFVDWTAVILCAGVLVTVMVISAVAQIVLRGVDMAHWAVEAIPVIE